MRAVMLLLLGVLSQASALDLSKAVVGAVPKLSNPEGKA